MLKIFCLIWSDLFNFSPQATPFALVPLWDAFGDEGEWEGYGRDEKNPSRAQTLCTTAFQAIMGGMRDFLQDIQKVSLIFEDSRQTCCNSD